MGSSRNRAKRRISLSIGAEEAQSLGRLSGYASAIASELFREFFERHTVEDVWAAMEMDRPISEKERMTRLQCLIRAALSGIPGQQRIPKKRQDYWEWS